MIAKPERNTVVISVMLFVLAVELNYRIGGRSIGI